MKPALSFILAVTLVDVGLCTQLNYTNTSILPLTDLPSFRGIDLQTAHGNSSQLRTDFDSNNTITLTPARAVHYDDVKISEELYERLVYFSKICALTYCITSSELVTGLTFEEGGCPARLEFCTGKEQNPTADRTMVELVLLAESEELGTGYLAVDHEKQVVMLSFRGSTTNQDWLSDFAIYPTPYEPASKEYYDDWVTSGRVSECEGCLIHRGFNVFLKTLSSQFFDRIESIFDSFPAYSLVVTGHSLGAAVASLAGIELRLRGYDPLVLTYASPNIFCGKLRAWVDELFETERIHNWSVSEGEIMFRKGYFRVVHDEDYITMVPPFYEPAGLEIFINHRELPQTQKHLEYRGPSMKLISTESMDTRPAFSSSGIGLGHRLLGPLEKWLHMYEHRAYFILINTCGGF
ncbi:LANO_0E06018g1_1 [Lachancea nothofagi CBS 11611]|uniref:triacylglycerol lipase n=1 Tax=Lachancea nothofagi CBS 11611 TaxID=1266666 RepID=A0A1G4JTI0_9SACH|nr:LANO_0E06018g1_1 [Lachancea nothofagi CBS 11611]